MAVRLFRPSLRRLLSILFLLLAAIPAGAIGFLLTSSVWERELQKAHEQHLQLARYLAEGLARYAEDAEATLHLAASLLGNRQPGQELALLLDRMHFKHVCLVDHEGVVKQFVSPDPAFHIERLPPHLLQKLRIVGHGLERSHIFSDLLPDQRGDPTIYLWYPLGEDRYALGALKTEYLVKLQSAIHFGEKGHATIVDHTGRVIAHPNLQWRTMMKDLSQLEPVRRMIAGETGVSRFFSPAGQTEMIAGFTTTPKTGWGIMVPQPLSELEVHVGRVKRAVWSVIGIALLGAAVLGGFVSRFLALPLRRIGLVAEQFANGFYEVRVRDLGMFATREAAGLAAQFNAMADEVNHSWHAQRESEQRVRAFAEIAADWFWETDLHQTFTYVSPPSATGRLWDSSTLLGHHRREHILDDPAEKTVTLIQSYMDRHESFDNITYQICGSDGQPIHLSVAGRPIRNVAGRVIGYRGVAQDITERLRTEAQLRHAQEEEQQRHVRKMEAIGTLAGGIAHDFNNILMVILGFTELTLGEMSPGSKTHQRLQQVLTAGKRAKELVQQILTFSRKSEPERKPLRLHLVINEALKLIRASLPSTISLLPDIDEDVGTILGDPTQIHQVVMNLCANAEYAMRQAGGVLKVRLDVVVMDDAFVAQHPALHPGPHVRFTVQDTGPGIAPEILERIFEPFFTTKDIGEGSGMGLAVVHGIVSSHHGIITVESHFGKGTTFEVYLPQIEAQTDDDISPQASIPKGKGTILFVEDESALAFWGQETLQNLGYHVEVKTDVRQALAVFRAAPHRFDLVITDQTMPHMTGEMLAREIRRLRYDIPIILCTGFSHIIDADKAHEEGINAFLMKPLLAADLAQAIQHILTKPASSPF